MIFRSIVVLTIFYISFVNSDEFQIVLTKNGAVKGKIYIDYNRQNFLAFQAIPYAKPPIGKLRFRAPKNADNWFGILQNQAEGKLPECPQMISGQPSGSEDCLYLNVYTRNVSQTPLRPVMVYIHEGGFIKGSADINMYGPQFLMIEDVVVVNINYRLGALGFLSLEDPISGFSSNNGLKDQVAALKWVQKNIKQFGGDPKQVTIFGQSVGGASVHYLILSPLAKGLFHKAIMQSGNAYSSRSIGIRNSAINFAKAFNISSENLKKMICNLRKLSIEQILKKQTELGFGPNLSTPGMGMPCIENPGKNSFLTTDPRNLITSGNFTKVPFLLGFNNQEGILYCVREALSNSKFIFKPEIYVPYNFKSDLIEEVMTKQVLFYWNGTNPDRCKEAINISGDADFKYGVYRSAKEHSKYQNNLFLYELSLDTELNYYKRQHPITAELSGASHVDDLGYIFQSKFTPSIKPGSVEEISMKRIVKLWTNFAKFGNPTPMNDSLLGSKWEPYSINQPNHLSIGKTLEAKFLRKDELEFWDELFNDYDTYKKIL